MEPLRHAPPPPVRVDLVRVVRVGLVAWGAALVVAVVLGATGVTTWTPAWVCAAGLVLGALALPIARRRSS